MNIQNLCDSIDSIKRLALVNNCFTVKMQQTVMAELCCLSRLAYPMDGFNRLSSPVVPYGSLELFDNGLDVSPLSDNMQARGIILCISYPAKDALGEDLMDRDKNAVLHMYDASGNSFDLPVCKTFILFGNPITTDTTKLMNRMIIENTGNYTIGLEGLVMLVNKNGMTLEQGEGGCC